MSRETVEDLKQLRAELVERRHVEAYRISGAHHEDRLVKLVLVDQAIDALDKVIAEGRDAPPPADPARFFDSLKR